MKSALAEVIGRSAATVVLCAMLAAAAKEPVHLTFLDTLNKGREVCLTDSNLAASGFVSSKVASSTSEQHGASVVLAQRFKIQVLAAKTEDEVQKEKTALAGKIGLPMTIIFETPFYKLLAGDFAGKDSAEAYSAKLRAMGYGDAWVVRKASPHQ